MQGTANGRDCSEVVELEADAMDKLHMYELGLKGVLSRVFDSLLPDWVDYCLKKLGVWCGVVWCGVVWCGGVRCDAVWCGVVWCGVVRCGCV